MKRLILLLVTGLTLLPVICPGAQTAQVRLNCRSLRVDGSRAFDTGGNLWAMDMTTINTGKNGELAPNFFGAPVAAYSNATLLTLTLVSGGGFTYDGYLAVNIPDSGDTNANGFPDFFEVGQGVAPSDTAGYYSYFGGSSGNFTANWTRDAGSYFGLLSIEIPNPQFAGNILFQPTFYVLEFTGPLDYTPGASNVTCTAALANTNYNDTLGGPLTFVKSATNRFNQLTLQSAFLTNMALQTLSLSTNTTFLRRAAFATNYFGLVEFNDGDINTWDPLESTCRHASLSIL